MRIVIAAAVLIAFLPPAAADIRSCSDALGMCMHLCVFHRKHKVCSAAECHQKYQQCLATGHWDSGRKTATKPLLRQ